MRIDRLLTSLIVLALGSSGCSNSCEKLCIRMADYAEECGYNLLDSELTECLDIQSEAPEEDIGACQDFNDPVTLRREWTCEDMQVYWDQGADGA
jgi:hypothetical protein